MPSPANGRAHAWQDSLAEDVGQFGPATASHALTSGRQRREQVQRQVGLCLLLPQMQIPCSGGDLVMAHESADGVNAGLATIFIGVHRTRRPAVYRRGIIGPHSTRRQDPDRAKTRTPDRCLSRAVMSSCRLTCHARRRSDGETGIK
jgi:hypothetical protein